jgi:hypothetical protein
MYPRPRRGAKRPQSAPVRAPVNRRTSWFLDRRQRGTIREDVVDRISERHLTGSREHMTIDSRDATAVPSVTTRRCAVRSPLFGRHSEIRSRRSGDSHHRLRGLGLDAPPPTRASPAALRSAYKHPCKPEPQVWAPPANRARTGSRSDPSDARAGAYGLHDCIVRGTPGESPADQSRVLGGRWRESNDRGQSLTTRTIVSVQVAAQRAFDFLPKSRSGHRRTFWPIPIPYASRGQRLTHSAGLRGSMELAALRISTSRPWGSGFGRRPHSTRVRGGRSHLQV